MTDFIAEQEGNILELDQHTDPQHDEFFMRVEVELDGFALNRSTFPQAWSVVADKFFENVPEELARKILWENAARVYHVDLPPTA